MTCDKCDGVTKVMETRSAYPNIIYRRRKCGKCGKIFYTCEEIDDTGYAKHFISKYHSKRS